MLHTLDAMGLLPASPYKTLSAFSLCALCVSVVNPVLLFSVFLCASAVQSSLYFSIFFVPLW